MATKQLKSKLKSGPSKPKLRVKAKIRKPVKAKVVKARVRPPKAIKADPVGKSSSEPKTLLDEATPALIQRIRERVAEALKEIDVPATIRGTLLEEGRRVTEGDRNAVYADPLENFRAITALKNVFWAFYARNHTAEHQSRFDRDTPHGHAIDMALTKLGRLMVTPQIEPHRDTYCDAAVYIAIAYEVAKRTPIAVAVHAQPDPV